MTFYSGLRFFLQDSNRRMAKSRRSRRSVKRRGSRRMRGGQAPVDYSSPAPMNLNLAQGRQFAEMHAGQHGGALNTSGAYPGVVTQASVLPGELVASAKLAPLNASFDYIKQFGPSSDNPNLRGGKRRRRRSSKKSRKSRKSRKASRKQRGGLYRVGGGRRHSRRSSRKYRGGAYAEMRFPMPVGEEGKMLIPASLEAQAGLNKEWILAKDPMAFAPKM
jgi:hypothetical protein